MLYAPVIDIPLLRPTKKKPDANKIATVTNSSATK